MVKSSDLLKAVTSYDALNRCLVHHAQGAIYALPEEVRQLIKEEIEHLRAENKRLHEHISKQDAMLRDCFAALTGQKK